MEVPRGFCWIRFQQVAVLRSRIRSSYAASVRYGAAMRISIRYQLLLPLMTLMLGLVGASAWSAYASGRHARAMIEKQIHDIAMTVHSTSFPLKAQTLQLMKGISGAEFLLCDANRQPL